MGSLLLRFVSWLIPTRVWIWLMRRAVSQANRVQQLEPKGPPCARCRRPMDALDAMVGTCISCQIDISAEKSTAANPQPAVDAETLQKRKEDYEAALPALNKRTSLQLPTARVRDLHLGVEVEPFYGQACWELHHGEVIETTRPHPQGNDLRRKMLAGFPATVGDLVREPHLFGFEPGEPIRYWALLPTRNIGDQEGSCLNLFELLPKDPPEAA